MTKSAKRLVIDTDVVSSAGGENATDVRSKTCRDLLKTILSSSHRIVITNDIQQEWKRHQSLFAKTWLRTMIARKQVSILNISVNDQLRLKIEKEAINEKKCEAMLKDIHLIEAALITDKIVISIDGTVKGYFQEVAPKVVMLRHVMWINPCIEEDLVRDWLVNGAKLEEKRFLGYQVAVKIEEPTFQKMQKKTR